MNTTHELSFPSLLWNVIFFAMMELKHDFQWQILINQLIWSTISFIHYELQMP